MSETEQLDILIRSIADGTGFTTSATQARAMNAEMAALGGSFHTHGNTIATAERDISKEADSMARALGSAGDQGAKALSRFEALGATMSSAGPLGIGIGAALVGFGAVYEVGKASIENAEKQERSARLLERAYASQGLTFSDYASQVQTFLDTNRRFIDDQYAARDAVAQLTTAGFSQTEVMRIMNDALDLAGIQGTDLATAEQTVLLGLEGNTRGFRDLGLTSKELAAAQKSAGTSAEAHAAVLDILEPKLKSGRQATTDLKQSQDDLKRSSQDTTAMLGPGLIQLASTGLDILNLSVKAGVLAGQHPDRIPRALGLDPTAPEIIPPAAAGGAKFGARPEIEVSTATLTLLDQRKRKYDDLLPSIQSANIASEAEGRNLDRLNTNLDREGDGLDHVATRNAIATQASYDFAVAHGTMETKITEVIGKWRDEADAMDRFRYHGSDALTQTQVVFDGFVKHIRDEKLDLKLTVDTSAAQNQVSDLLEHIRNSRANVQVGTTSVGNLGTLFSP